MGGALEAVKELVESGTDERTARAVVLSLLGHRLIRI